MPDSFIEKIKSLFTHSNNGGPNNVKKGKNSSNREKPKKKNEPNDQEFNIENLAEKIQQGSTDFKDVKKGKRINIDFGEEDINEFIRSTKEGVAKLGDIEGYREEERYWVNEPYSFIAILYNESINDYFYRVVEPDLKETETQAKRELEQRLLDSLIQEKVSEIDEKEELLEDKFRSMLNKYSIDLDSESFHKILYYLKRDYVGYEKIDPILRDPNIEDISCNSYDSPIFVYHREYADLMTNVTLTKEELNNFVIKLAQKGDKHISIAEPLIDASMPEGYRAQLALGKEVTSRGSAFTIRKYAEESFSPVKLVKLHTFSSEQMAYLWFCIENNRSLIFAGGTGSGKTTSMNAISLFIPPKSKISSIEDTRELSIHHENWIPSVTREPLSNEGEGRISMFDLLNSSLRQRPEYILVGEVRGEEATTLFQAMSTGHTCYSTLHADSIESAIHRLTNPPINIPRSMIDSLDIVSIQVQTNIGNKKVRRNRTISEILEVDPRTKNIRIDNVFEWDSASDEFEKVSESSVLEKIRKQKGWEYSRIEKELSQRKEVIDYLSDRGLTNWRETAKVIRAFMIDRDEVLTKIRNNELDQNEVYKMKDIYA